MEKELRIAEKELTKRKLQLAAPVAKHYFTIMLIVILCNFIVDMLASNINSIVLTDALFSILHITSRSVEDALYLKGFADYNLFHSLVSGMALIVLPFYKMLADKFGRKPFLWLNSLFTGVGMFIMMTANSVIGYLVGYVIISFFFNGDVHQLYLLEESPKEYRTTIVSAVKMFGVFGVSILGLFRRIFVTEATIVDGWRNLLFVCVIFVVPTVLLTIFSLKDTTSFIEERIKYLEGYIAKLKGENGVEEEKKEEKKEEKAAIKGGFINSLKYVFKHKQTRSIFFALIFLAAGMTFQTVYSTIVEGGNLSVEDVSRVAIIFPIVQGIFSVFNGLISDKFGRKTSFVVMGIISVIGYIGWVLFTNNGTNGYIVGLLYGLLTGGYWSARDLLAFNITSESTPTQMRATVMSVFGVSCTSSFGMFNLMMTQIIRFTGRIGLVFFIGYLVFLGLTLLFFITGVRETKNIDLDKVTGEEFDN